MDFGSDHLYVAGATTVDSFVLHENSVEWLDGTTGLAVAGGGNPAAGETSQVGAISAEQLLVTIKTDPNPGTVDVIALDRGRITGAAPTAVSAPPGSLAPFGFSTYPDGTALITLAHSDQDGLFMTGRSRRWLRLASLCVMTRVGVKPRGHYSQLDDQPADRDSSHVFVDAQIAAQVPTGSPADIDADSGVLNVIDHGAGQSHLSIFGYNEFGELVPAGATITVGVANANGVAILAPRDREEN